MNIVEETIETLKLYPNNFAACARHLGIHETSFTARVKRYGLSKDTPDLKSSIKDAINKSPLSMLEASKIAKMPYRTFIYRAQKFGLYKPNQHHKGRTFPNGGKNGYPLQEIFEGKHPKYRTQTLKNRLIKEGMLKEECSECGIGPIWNDKPIVLEMDHINGKRRDHRLENLRILCPNCHSQTPTFRGRNVKR